MLPLRHLVVALVLSAPAVGSAVRLASVDPSPSTIQACAALKDGRLRLVATGHECRRRERAVSWNVEGPRGETGPPGEQGPRGERGPSGPKGDPGAGVTSLETLAGTGCHAGGRDGTVSLDYDTAGHAVFTCVTAGTPAAVRINEFATGTASTLTDEFVELVNGGSSPADVGGYRLVYRSGSGTSDLVLATVPSGTTIAPGGFYLFGGGGYAGATAPDQSFSAGLASSAGGLGLRDSGGQLVDSVGYGTATNDFVERSAASAPPVTASPGSSAIRLPDGHDTDDNSADFSVSSTPTPRAPNRN